MFHKFSSARVCRCPHLRLDALNMSARVGVRAPAPFPAVDLPSLSHPQWVNQQHCEVDEDPSLAEVEAEQVDDAVEDEMLDEEEAEATGEDDGIPHDIDMEEPVEEPETVEEEDSVPAEQLLSIAERYVIR